MKTNFHTLAKDLCEQELGSDQVNIAQMKETLRLLADNIAVRKDVEEFWNGYVLRRRKILSKGQ
jgi:hypothetical protein